MSELFEQADGLLEAGDAAGAEGIYRRLIEVEPNNARAYFQLGNLMARLGNPAAAAEAFGRVVELRPEVAAAHFNLGNAYSEVGKFYEAEGAYRRSLELSTDIDADAAYNLARTLAELGRIHEAADFYERAIASDPRHFRAISNLAQLLFELGRVDEAIDLHRQASQLEPDNAAEQFMLAQTLAARWRFDESIAALRQSLVIEQHSSATHLLLGKLLHLTGQHQELREAIANWQLAIPHDPQGEHMRAAWLGEPRARASEDYVRSHFDAFAADFDTTLLRLQYRAPQLVAGVIQRHYPGQAELELLDAGCGTGLCGPLLRPFAQRLIGLDLSPGMLHEAAKREAYDELVEAELVAYLRGCSERFDVVACADTLCYFGDLSEVLAATGAALRPSGRFVFTVELLAADSPVEFRLHAHGRYSHTENYVRHQLAHAGLRRVELQTEVLRMEGREQVVGLVVLGSKV
jgi:predicted TPR repeat methyltransferase